MNKYLADCNNKYGGLEKMKVNLWTAVYASCLADAVKEYMGSGHIDSNLVRAKRVADLAVEEAFGG